MTVKLPRMLFQERPGQLNLIWRSQKAYGSITISTMAPMKGTA